jgi:NosR/NirI family nitrous oxide reductase transcriptional regulator
MVGRRVCARGLILGRFLLAAPFAILASGAWGGAYEAALPADLASAPDLCALVACRNVLHEADGFSTRKGHPPYVEAYDGHGDKRRLVGYVFLSTDVVDIPGYSGKPLVTLVGMDTSGHITGAQVLKHSEPILLVGIPEDALSKFIHQFVGRLASERLHLGKAHDGDNGAIDAISGATVTVLAENQTIMQGAYAIAREVGIVKAQPRPAAKLAPFHAAMSWKQLVDEGAVARLTVHPSELGLPATGEPYIDMYFGDLVAPDVGRSILGAANYARLMADLAPGEHAIFVAANGTGSFKGSAFVRGGIFDRIHLRQDHDTFTFRDTDYRNLYGIEAAGAPALRESGIFIVHDHAFSAAYPWRLVFLGNRVDRASGAKTFVNFEREYWLPARMLDGGRPAVAVENAAWIDVWKAKALPLAALVLILGAASVTYALRDRLVRRASRRDKRWVEWPRYGFLVLGVGFIGFHLKAQPSITQVLTWFHALIFEWHWELFLSDPFVFVFWWFVIAGVFFVGRGLFCGWLCPYGSLQEVAFRLAGKLGLARFQFALPKRWHDRLKWVKYAVFALLLAVSFHSMGTAEKLAEVEPFKTTFLVGVWHRSWPYALFFATLLVWAMLSERPFCKYLCPLGAGLAIPSTFRNFALKRKAECTSCHACGKGCSSLAIDDQGRIDQRECLLCLDCQVLYYDTHACPPLAKERKAREKAGIPLTRIAGNGYYIPIVSLAAPPRAAATPRTSLDVPLRVADRSASLLRWLWEEAKFHLLPWRADHHDALKAAGVGLAVVVTVLWLLSGTGHVGPTVVNAWWIGWSVYEVASRRANLPWIKDGRWWKRDFRAGTTADIAAYVATKNLLIGVLAFGAMHSAGMLDLLARTEVLRWLH